MRYEPHLDGRIACRTLEEHARRTTERYDVVTLWHVLEHLRDPCAAAAQVGEFLADDGLAVIAVPNARGRMYTVAAALAKTVRYGRLMEELWYKHNPNMHRYYPTHEALRHLLGRGGLRIVDAYSLDAFDWERIWRRSTNAAGRLVLRMAGPELQRSRFTGNENLIVVARRA